MTQVESFTKPIQMQSDSEANIPGHIWVTLGSELPWRTIGDSIQYFFKNKLGINSSSSLIVFTIAWRPKTWNLEFVFQLLLVN